MNSGRDEWWRVSLCVFIFEVENEWWEGIGSFGMGRWGRGGVSGSVIENGWRWEGRKRRENRRSSWR